VGGDPEGGWVKVGDFGNSQNVPILQRRKLLAYPPETVKAKLAKESSSL
jgi:hypothetical protein